MFKYFLIYKLVSLFDRIPLLCLNGLQPYSKNVIYNNDIITFYPFMETLLVRIRRLSLSIAAVLFINESVKGKHKLVV